MSALLAEKKVKFKDAASAVAWAEEMLDRSGGVQSQIGNMTRVPGAGDFTMPELYDQALSISMAAQKVKHPVGVFFAQMFGRDDAMRRMEICGAMVAWMRSTYVVADGKHHLQFVNLMDTLLRGYRSYILLGKRQRLSDVACSIGVTRENLKDDGWLDIIKAARDKFDAWLDIGERELCDILNERGFIA